MKKLRLSYSSLNLFNSCARKFELNKIYRHFQRPRSSGFAAEVGTSLHAGFQNYLIHADETEAKFALLKSFPHELQYYQTNTYRDVNAALSTLESMIENYEAEPELALAYFQDSEGKKKPCIEVPFEIIIEGAEIPGFDQVSLMGYIDAVMLKSGEFGPLDIKTHRDWDSVNLDAKYVFNTQQVPYGLVIDHIAGSKQQNFTAIYMDCYVDLIKPRVHFLDYQKDAQKIERWLTEFILTLRQLKNYILLDTFPRTNSGCVSYGSPCYFLDLCEEERRDQLQRYFLSGKIESELTEEELAMIAREEDRFQPWITIRLPIEKGLV
jgi:hypothetical protein